MGQIKDQGTEKLIADDTDLIPLQEDGGTTRHIKKINLLAGIGGGSSSLFIQILDKRPSGTVGGFASQNTWTTRPINTIQTDDTTVVTLSSNSFILPSGTYELEAEAAFYQLYDTKMRLQNITNNSTLIYGLISQFNPNAGFVGHAHLSGKFIISAAQSLQLQYFTVSGGSSSQYNLGGSVNDGSPEIYAVVDLRKVA